jgi:hypothetical protein
MPPAAVAAGATTAPSPQPRPLESHVSPDIFLHVPASLTHREAEAQDRCHGSPALESNDVTAATCLNLVFFITGNPGLIAYYHPFLAGLAKSFDGDEERGNGEDGAARNTSGGSPVIAGFSLGGFEAENWMDMKRSAASTSTAQSAKGREELSRKTELGEKQESLRELLFPGLVSSSASSSPRVKHSEAKTSPMVVGDRSRRDKIYTLTEQVELCYTRLENLVANLRHGFASVLARPRQGLGDREGHGAGDDAPATTINVTLIGHSVGAYIALELVRIWHERGGTDPLLSSSATLTSTSRDVLFNDTTTNTTSTTTALKSARWAITSSILLTPTIQDLHLSASGRIAGPLLQYAPFLPALAHGLVQNVLVKCLTDAWFEGLVQLATGMRPGSHGLFTTVEFLRSRLGVRQALEMARLELREIRDDKWGEEVWGATASGGDGGDDDEGDAVCEVGKNPRLYFWFAKQDHWVADVTREEILRGRGKTGFVESEDDLQSENYHSARTRTPRIRIDETGGLVHAWCLEPTQTKLVTRRVSGWLKELWDENKSR